VRGVVNKIVLSSILMLALGLFSTSYAGMNPFKKSKNYTFGSDITWYEHNDVAIKSGSVRDGADTNYYHLNIDKSRILLRLGRNDPSGEIENTRRLDRMSILEVKTDGRRLPLFDWCLKNQQDPGKKLKQNAVVVNDVCVNAGGGGDFILNLDEASRNILQNAASIEFVVEPYARPVKLTFSLLGYAAIMEKINRPVPPPVVKKAPVKAVVLVKPKPRVKPKPKPKPVKKCYAKAPADFRSAVPAISYACKSTSAKVAAESKIAAAVDDEKKKMQAELAAAEKEKVAIQKSVEDNRRETEWDEKQAKLWISRCERHWAKNTSPCYCEKYLDLAPPGISNTCGK